MVCVQRHNQLRFMPWEVDITTHENAEITNWIHPGFTVSSLDQPGWTWNKSSTRLRLIYFPGTIPSSVNMLLELIWRLSLQQRESEVTWSCPTLCNPVDCSPLGSSVHGILQARTLEWVAILFSSESNPGLSYCRQVCQFISPSTV